MASGGPGGGQAGAAGKVRRGVPCALSRARLGSLRSHQCALLLAGLLAVCAFYYVGSGRETFSSATRRLKESRAGGTAGPAQAPASDAPLAPEAKAKPADGLSAGAAELDYHVLMMFTKADRSPALQAKGRTALSSLLQLAKLDEQEVLNVHFVSEEASKEIAKNLLRELLPGVPFKYKVIFHDVGVLTEKLFPVVEAMQKHFSAGSGTYYGDSIFFLSVAMHQIMPKASADSILRTSLRLLRNPGSLPLPASAALAGGTEPAPEPPTRAQHRAGPAGGAASRAAPACCVTLASEGGLGLLCAGGAAG
ncbi:xyloside xylosyltransferase 1 [Trichosurus vulpecula]|uniref:xyloside xylosyltransferase 1 n=1 Tax=Trichosurus vulpecula TaxID=9337 RepID=UPI00186AC72D|nr:xyloside xylosyltransferase 1 [Trichosurus vulpecula]